MAAPVTDFLWMNLLSFAWNMESSWPSTEWGDSLYELLTLYIMFTAKNVLGISFGIIIKKK